MSNKRINKKVSQRSKPSSNRNTSNHNISNSSHSLKEIQNIQDQEKQRQEMFAKVQSALQIADLTKNSTKSYSVFSKEKLRTYLKSPQQNSNNLIQLSRFLKRYCQSYSRLISYSASMVKPEYYTVNPVIDFNEEVHDDAAILQNYYNSCLEMRKLNLKSQAFTILSELWTVGAVYCYKYQDEKTTLWYILDPEYCKVSSQNYDGSLNFAFDFSYFRSNATYLDYFDKEFTQKFRKYEKDSSLRWQELEPNKTMMLKIGMNNLDLVIPPLTPLFEQMIDLVDLQGLTAQRDELSTYKLVWAKLDTLANATEADEWSVDPLTAIPYYGRMVNESLPPGVHATITPLDLQALNFKDDETLENNRINNALKNLFKNSGGSQILDSTEISGSQGFMSACICDEMISSSEIRPMLEVITNRHIEYNLPDHAPISYIEVSPYTRISVLDQMLKTAQYSIPDRMAIASLQGKDPITALSNGYLENTILKLQTNWIPLSSSFTNGGKTDDTDEMTGGRPTQDDVTSEGQKSRDRADR